MAFTKVTNAGIGSTNTVLLHNLNVVGTVTATDGIFSGIGSFGGNVSVGGVLTYEDVTNVDSVGLITARKGISVLGAGVTIAGGGLNVNAGVSTFGGNVTVGSGITLSPDGDVYSVGISTFKDIIYIADKILHDGDGNTGIRFPDADTFSVETAGTQRVRITSGGDINIHGRTSASTTDPITIDLGGQYTADASITHQNLKIKVFSNSSNNDSGGLTAAQSGMAYVSPVTAAHLFYTAPSSVDTIVERVRITPAGNVGIGSAIPTDIFDVQTGSSDEITSFKVRTSGRVEITRNHSDSPYIKTVMSSGNPAIHLGDTGGDKTVIHGHGTSYFNGGKLLLGTTSARTNFRNGATGNSTTPQYQFETANDDALNDISLTYGRNNAYGAEIILAKHRTATVGGTTIVQSGDRLGGITFSGSDGTNFQPAAFIEGEVDGTPGADDMPGRLVFATTADGEKVPTERLRITKDGAVQLNADTGTHYISVGASQDFKWYHDAGGPTIMSDTGNQGFKLSIKDLNLTDYSGVTSKINLTSGGFVGINQSAPIKMLHVVENNSASGNIVAKFKGGTGADSETFIAIVDGYSDTANDVEGHVKIGAKRNGSGNQAHMIFHTYHSSSMAERMRITSAGSLYHGCTTAPDTDDPGASFQADANQGQLRVATNSSGSAVLCTFYNANGNVGDIRTSGSGTQYNTSSDYRLKENAVAISDGITRLKTLKPYRFNFKSDPSTTVDGFFAHEVTAVPESITGTKDQVATSDDVPSELLDMEVGDPIYQSIDQSKLVPLLTAALQEEISKREALEARVAALESS